MTSKRVVILSPFFIIGLNLAIAHIFGQFIGKWAFIPMNLICWTLWLIIIFKFGGKESIRSWLNKSKGKIWWPILAILIGLIPVPLFIFHFKTLSSWTIWLPWIVIAIINPWIEEFYWRGLLLDYTKNWKSWIAILYSSLLFSINHIAYGVNSALNSGFEILISTLLMGIIWGIVYKKTKSLRWVIFAHFLVDFFGLSVSAFLDLWEKGTW